MKCTITDGHERISLSDESAPLQKNKSLDKFTRVKWYVPLIIYIRIIVYFFYKGYTQMSGMKIVIIYLVGVFIWTLQNMNFTDLFSF
jgi:Ca2+-dependent lipid-binding protein